MSAYITRESCVGCNSVPGGWICLFHDLPFRYPEVMDRHDELYDEIRERQSRAWKAPRDVARERKC